MFGNLQVDAKNVISEKEIMIMTLRVSNICVKFCVTLVLNVHINYIVCTHTHMYACMCVYVMMVVTICMSVAIHYRLYIYSMSLVNTERG